MEKIQRCAGKFILDLPFICDVGYSVRLEQLDLIPLCFWHEFLDMVFYFKCINGIINIHDDVLPQVLNKERVQVCESMERSAERVDNKEHRHCLFQKRTVQLLSWL